MRITTRIRTRGDRGPLPFLERPFDAYEADRLPGSPNPYAVPADPGPQMLPITNPHGVYHPGPQEADRPNWSGGSVIVDPSEV